jgi:hypothetical protein
VAEFVLELYASRHDPDAVEQHAARAREAAAQLTREGGDPVRFVRAIFLPEDETCFYLYDAASVDLVLAAAQRAQLRVIRVVDAITTAKQDRTGCQ